MATRDTSGRVTETPSEATQAEDSRDSYYVLKVSMALAIVAGIALFWYFGVFAGWDHSLPRKPA
jgi:hypothetical protein